MLLVKTRGIVLKTQDIKENDKLVWAYTENLGKISIYVKGAKKSKSKLFTITNTFAYSEIMVYKGKSFYYLNEGNLIESFNEVMNDLDSLFTGAYFNELVEISSIEEEENQEVFRLLVSAFYLIKSKSIDLELLARAFEIKLFNITGFNLNLEFCTSCGEKIKISNYFDVENYGVVCENCKKGTYIKISPSTYNSIRFINNSSLDRIERLKLSETTKEEIKRVNIHLIKESYGKLPNSLKMFKILKEE